MTLFRIVNNCLLGGLDTTLCWSFYFFNWLLGHGRECFGLSPGSALGMIPGVLRGPYMMPGMESGLAAYKARALLVLYYHCSPFVSHLLKKI